VTRRWIKLEGAAGDADVFVATVCWQHPPNISQACDVGSNFRQTFKASDGNYIEELRPRLNPTINQGILIAGFGNWPLTKVVGEPNHVTTRRKNHLASSVRLNLEKQNLESTMVRGGNMKMGVLKCPS
jgi:hypothetical protein